MNNGNIIKSPTGLNPNQPDDSNQNKMLKPKDPKKIHGKYKKTQKVTK